MKTMLTNIALVGVCIFAGAGSGHIAFLINQHFKHTRLSATLTIILMTLIVCAFLIIYIVI